LFVEQLVVQQAQAFGRNKGWNLKRKKKRQKTVIGQVKRRHKQL
jgi:hypothetical protein